MYADGYIYQTYQTYNTSATYYRSYYNGTWYSWKRVFAHDDSGDYIADNTIDSSEIQNNTLTADDLANNSVGNAELIDNPTVNTIYASNWFRSNGSSGWYNETYGGGVYMSDTTWVRLYNNKNLYTAGIIRADNGFVVDDITIIA